MKVFPSGRWRVRTNLLCDDYFAEFRYDAASNRAFLKWRKGQGGAITGTAYGKEVSLGHVKVSSNRLKAEFHKLQGHPQSGALTATVKSDGGLSIKYEIEGDFCLIVSRWQWCTAVPVGDSLKPNLANAGYRHQVRFAGGGYSIMSGANVTMGNIEVRDLGACWERHYALAATGAGASVGVSFPSSTHWLPCSLTPRCANWTGTKVLLHTAGAAVVVGYNSCSASFKMPGGAKWIGTWAGWGVNLEAKIDLTTIVIGKLLTSVYSRPYIAGT